MARLAVFVLFALQMVAARPAMVTVAPATVSAAVDATPIAVPRTGVDSARVPAIGLVPTVSAMPRERRGMRLAPPRSACSFPDLRLVARRVRPSADVPRLRDADPH